LLAELPICVCPISHFFKCLKSKFVSKIIVFVCLDKGTL
jgi:hypothetical protein